MNKFKKLITLNFNLSIILSLINLFIKKSKSNFLISKYLM